MNVDRLTARSSTAPDRNRAHPLPDMPGLERVGDQRRLRKLLAKFATGVTVVTVGGANSHGMTANAFTSVSMDPPLVLLCVKHNARMHQALLDSDAFAISILSGDQESVARYFSHGDRAPGTAQFDGVDWVPGEWSDAPLITGALGWLECSRWCSYDGGDHTIFVGRLVAAGSGGVAQPLVFHDGKFCGLSGEVTGDIEQRQPPGPGGSSDR